MDTQTQSKNIPTTDFLSSLLNDSTHRYREQATSQYAAILAEVEELKAGNERQSDIITEQVIEKAELKNSRARIGDAYDDLIRKYDRLKESERGLYGLLKEVMEVASHHVGQRLQNQYEQLTKNHDGNDNCNSGSPVYSQGVDEKERLVKKENIPGDGHDEFS